LLEKPPKGVSVLPEPPWPAQAGNQIDRVDAELIQRAVREALREDVGPGDATTLATIPFDRMAIGRMVARQDLIVCGLFWASEAFGLLDPDCRVSFQSRDGDRIQSGGCALEVRGRAGPMLTAERTALNFVQRLSGIATFTSRYVEAIAGTSSRILDTRKTTPGWRVFEKYAVRCGGGTNHRLGLFDRILIKDNHRVALADEAGGSIRAAVERARAAYPHLEIEVEADTLADVEEALSAGARLILLDNMSLVDLRRAVALCRGRARTEASGGINLQTVREVALTGVDEISVGALTHSAPAADWSLDFDELR